jgi:hypothetical protein
MSTESITGCNSIDLVCMYDSVSLSKKKEQHETPRWFSLGFYNR